MIVQINGTNNVNKGAELMFCAICQELEKRCPNSTVIMQGFSMQSPYKSTELKIKLRKDATFIRLMNKFHIAGILRKLSIPVWSIEADYCPPNVDIVLDASGFSVGDIWTHTSRSNKILERKLKNTTAQGTKIIYLPQAFGPFTKEESKNAARLILKYANIIFAREKQSYENLKSIGMPMDKVRISPDFTTSVKGMVSPYIQEHQGSIIVIPSKRMLMEKKVGINDYVNLIKKCDIYAENQKREILILNHEGDSDLDICHKINQALENRYKVITNLSALETKGILSIAYAVISSRFHGTASALSCGVPCISSSWNPKYELLYEDYGLSNMIVDLTNGQDIETKLQSILMPQKNYSIRNTLKEKVISLERQNREMWNYIFEKYGK